MSRVGIGHRGYVRGLIRVHGRQAHASVPSRGVNAFEKACELAGIIKREYALRLEEVKSNFPIHPEEASKPTITLGGYAESTSRKDNIVPGEFVFSFDRRVIPEEDADSVARGFKEFVEEAARRLGVRAEVEVKSLIPGSVTSKNSPIVRLALEAARRAGVEAEPVVLAGRTDQVYYSRRGSAVITWGPGVLGVSHGVDEYVTIEEVARAIRAYAYMLELAPRYLSI